MRVIAGSAKGLGLQAPAGNKTRPTTDRVKEAIFSMIQFEVRGSRVWDAFAGSGGLAIEALSRGAEYAVLTDSSAVAIKAITTNLKKARFSSDSYCLKKQNALQYLQNSDEEFDVVFLDPPYYQNLLQELLEALVAKLKTGALIIIESDGREDYVLNSNDFQLEKAKRYGQIEINIYRRK